jgi:hypothetical protein
VLNRLKILVVLFVVALGLLASQSSALAQTVGSHLGVGDVGGQINNIQILRSNGAESGFPVTALVNVNSAANANNEQDLRNLAAAINSAGFYPIIRITNVCDASLTQEKVRTAITNINSQFDTVVIVYGNEVNNREAECSSWEQYVKEYQWVSDMPNVAPAALDYYMGNPEFAASAFLNTPGAAAIYSAGNNFVANAYGCVGARDANCEPTSTATQEVGYSPYAGKNYYLTEFSLSPEGRVADAPDTNLEKVIEFIQGRAGSTGAQLITPLVRNVCNSQGEWLLYVNGRLFTVAGTDVTENCEGDANLGTGYDKSQYPTYDVDQNRYYLHPIKGVHPLSSPGGRSVAVARQDMASQGYEAYCAAESTKIGLDYNTEELIRRFVQINPTGVSLPTVSSYAVSSENGQVSLFRDTNDRRFLTSSIEEYFSFKDVYNEDELNREVSTAPINSLLSQDQKCVQAVRLLTATELMCERLVDPGQCALLTREIPGTNYTVGSIYGDLREAIPGYREGRIAEECDLLYRNNDPRFDRIKQGIQNTPLNLERSYRLAFLVASIENRSPLERFNFFSLLSSPNPRNEVLIVAFKIPDIITNKGGIIGTEGGGHWGFTDAATHTRDVLVPRFFATSIFEPESQRRRTEIRDEAMAASLQAADDRIYCLQGDGDTDEQLAGLNGSPACKDVLGKAVVDLINGRPPSCDELESEPAREILEAASILPPAADDPSRVFNPGYGLGEDVLNYIFLNPTNENQQRANNRSLPFVSNILVNQSWELGFPSEEANVDFFLVYPVGYELESITNVMKHTFLAQGQVENLEEQDTKTRFDTSGFNINLSGGSVSHTFNETDLSQCDERIVEINFRTLPDGTTIPLIPPEYETQYDCERTFSIDIDERGSGDVKILGAQLGYWLRNVQKTLNTFAGEAHAFISSCRTMEDFLVGRCTRGSSNPGGFGLGANPNGASCDIGTGPCSIENLLPYFESAGFDNPELEAEKASRICNRESGSNHMSINDGCLTGSSVDYSIGLFQVNLMAHCAYTAFADGSGNRYPNFDAFNLPCTIVDQDLVDQCTTQLLDPNGNIEKMLEIRQTPKGWGHWSAAAVCGIQ